MAHEAVVTPWEKKGLVMRTVMEWAKDRERLLVDGVKVLHDDGWALIFPDPEEPLTHVWAEAGHRFGRPGPGPGIRSSHPQRAAILIGFTSQGLVEGGTVLSRPVHSRP